MTIEANRRRHQAFVNLDWRILARTLIAEMQAEGIASVGFVFPGVCPMLTPSASSHSWYSECAGVRNDDPAKGVAMDYRGNPPRRWRV